MRSAAQLTRTPGEYADYQRAERQAILRDLLRTLERARASGEEWYTWVAEGRPELSPAEYERRQGGRARERRAARRGRSGE